MVYITAMPKPVSPFCRDLIELFDALGVMSARRMFGCTGLFANGLMFGLVSPDEGFYVKADGETRDRFDAAGCPPFTYRGKRGEIAISYLRLPDAVMEDAAALMQWARLGMDAACRQASHRGGADPSASDPWRSLIR